jgi:hypothetical protein
MGHPQEGERFGRIMGSWAHRRLRNRSPSGATPVDGRGWGPPTGWGLNANGRPTADCPSDPIRRSEDMRAESGRILALEVDVTTMSSSERVLNLRGRPVTLRVVGLRVEGINACGVHLFGSPSGAGHLDLGLNQSSARGKRRRFADAPDGTPSKLSGRRSGLARESSIGPGRVGPVVVPLGNSPPIP